MWLYFYRMRDFFKDAFFWIALAVAGKVVRDSLPPMGVKVLWGWLKGFFMGLAYAFSVLWLLILLLSNHSKNPQKAQQQVLLTLFLFLGITLLYLHGTGKLKREKSGAKGLDS